uniref:RNA helicase n=1 Tax=Dendroctonus ponderosae TaxID=77166 RepID=A0AAR5P8T6_DENPD
MLRYILSYFRNQEPELSNDDVTQILAQDTEHTNHWRDNLGPKAPTHREQFKNEYNFATKTGVITGHNDDTYVIDNLLEFTPEDEQFELGDTVSYQQLFSDGKIAIYNVNLISNDWDRVAEKQSIVTTRIMISKVERRDKRIMILRPGNIKVDLDKVSIEFVPSVGDWLELDVKYEVDEQTLDLSGKVIEVNKISPIRPHIQSGKITSWDALEGTGSISSKIFVDKNAIRCGYIPVVGDQVLAEIIESDQLNCTWRALKILPEHWSKKVQSGKSANVSKMKESHPGLEISYPPLTFDKLGVSKSFTIALSNQSQDLLELKAVETSECSQVHFAEPILDNKPILPGETLNLNVICTPKTMGSSNELIEFQFIGFTIGKYINIQVNSHKTGGLYNRNTSINYSNSYQSTKHLVSGQKSSKVRFHLVRIPEYAAPKKLLDLVIKYGQDRDNPSFIEELKVAKPSLFTNLNHMNYEEKFHTLLHMEEITNLMLIRQYDQDRACFIKNGEFLMLEIENLAERRPSIVLGDRIIASDTLTQTNQEYEGNVYKVGAKHVYLKFSLLFHDKYNGEDYSIRVIPGRASFKRQHHAVYLAARHLGRKWLFPTQVVQKEPQLNFVYESYLNAIEESKHAAISNKHSENSGTTGHFKADVINQDGNIVTNIDEAQPCKLEWYNRHLNCKQKDAVINVLKGTSRPLPYIIFGPPGTGKTVTMLECILQIVRLIPNSRLLVTAPSNSAADLIALRLIDFGILKPGDLVRIVSINYAVGENIPAKLVPYCATASVAKEGTKDENILDQNGMTFDCSREVLGRHKITISTCSSAATLHMMGFPRGHFTHIFVDEAGQAAEPEVMISISFLDKYIGQVVLAGDPMQLGPVVLCKIAQQCGLSESYLERLTDRFPYSRDIQGFPTTEGFDPRLVTKLLHNYRSASVILNLFSELFYHGDLIATITERDSPEYRLLNSLASILPKTADNAVPSVVFHGVEGENYQTPDSPSWFNPHEAAQVFYYVNELFRLGLSEKNIGIITPYTKQVKEIRELLKEAEFSVPRVGTVEDFQGVEFDVIILSTVRSSQNHVARDVQHGLGFLSNPRRLNVALSRPKSLLIIIGNPGLLASDTCWRHVIQYCVKNGAYTGCTF